jgi:DnaJ-class molecular chaperone
MSDKTHKAKDKQAARAVKLPKKLTKEQKSLLENFEAELAASHQRIQALKAETETISRKTDLILDALS